MTSLKAALKKLTKKERELIPRAFDTVGTIAIFNDFPSELKKKEKYIAETLLKLHKPIKTVAKKSGIYKGKLRTPKITILAGEKTKETTHKENNVALSLNVETCYFSTRSSNERKRIAKLVKKGEKVLVLFSGVAPFPCVIAKNSKAQEVYGIELNKKAYKYALKNVEKNKLNNITLLQGDVKKVLPTLRKKFDRILLPLPKDAEKFVTLAKKKLQPEGVLHVYSFAKEEEFSIIKKQYKKQFKTVKIVKAGVFGPKIYRICIDVK